MTAAKGPRLLFFLSLFFRSAPTSGKEQTEFQIAHRWYNFHFSSPTAEARPPSAHPAPPPTEVKAGPGRGGQQRPRASPGGARQRSCGSSRSEDQLQLRAAPSSAQPLARSRRGLRSRKLGPRALGPEDCSPSRERRVRSPRAREGANARMLLRRRAAARQGGLRGPQNKELSGGTYLRLWLSGPKSTDPRRRSGGRLGLPWMARLVAVCGRGGHGGARTGGGASGRGGERRTGGRVCGRRRRGPVRSLPPLQPAHQFQGSCNLIPLSHRP